MFKCWCSYCGRVSLGAYTGGLVAGELGFESTEGEPLWALVQGSKPPATVPKHSCHFYIYYIKCRAEYPNQG